ETFSLIGLGLIAGMVGATIDSGIAWNLIPARWDLLGRRLLTEGMVLLLVLGVGGFLGPRLLGFAALPRFSPVEALQPMPQQGLFYRLSGLAILLFVIAEYGFGTPLMAFLRAVVATIVISSTVQPWRFPSVHTTLARCVWIAHWLVILALWLVA